MSELFIPDFIRCPICGAALVRDGGSLYCCGERRHTYDIAKEEYVCLLPPGRAKNAHTGDDAEMIRARDAFLSGGGYDRYSREAVEYAAGFLAASSPSCDALHLQAEVVPIPSSAADSRRSLPTEASPSCDALHLQAEAVPKIKIIDAGCGEGRHTVNMANTIAGVLGRPVTAVGFDASKHGVRAAAKRYVKRREMLDDGNEASFFTANIFDLPVADLCADMFTSLFAPLPDEEARRVLKTGGVLVICAAGADHLSEMRSVLYNNPISSGGGASVPEGFSTAGKKVIEYPLTLSSNEEIMSLFTMTPFYHNAPAEGREKLAALDSLTVTVQVYCTVAIKM